MTPVYMEGWSENRKNVTACFIIEVDTLYPHLCEYRDEGEV